MRSIGGAEPVTGESRVSKVPATRVWRIRTATRQKKPRAVKIIINHIANSCIQWVFQERSHALRTIYLSRLLGYYSILVSLSMIVHKQATVAIFSRLSNHAGAPFAIGLIAIAVGLAMILAHNVWSGGALPVVVTLIGWWSLIKGLLCLFLPAGVIAGLLGGPCFERYFYAVPVVTLLVGLYLIIASSLGKAEQATVK